MITLAYKAQSLGLAFISKIAASPIIDQLKLRILIEKSLYQGSKASFKTLTATKKIIKSNFIHHKQRLAQQKKSLFDLNLTEEQQMICDTMSQLAKEVLYPLAHNADHHEKFPTELWKHSLDLGINYYALPETFGGVASEKKTLSHLLIAEQLAQGDFSLSAGLLSTFSVINAITHWGSKDIQNKYLASIAENPEIQATFATQEASAAFNPFQLKTQASLNNGQYLINGEKTLVILGEYADVILLSATFNAQPDIFIVLRDNSISFKKSPAMGLKAAETVNLSFNNTPAQRLTDDDFDYSEFLDLGNLMWCSMALGTCESAKQYCIQYSNERIAFGEPISHRQSIAFMIADMAIEIESMRMMILNAANRAESGLSFHREAYLARILCAEKSMKIGTDAVQLLGGHGYTKEHPVERWYRDLRATAILQSGLHA